MQHKGYCMMCEEELKLFLKFQHLESSIPKEQIKSIIKGQSLLDCLNTLQNKRDNTKHNERSNRNFKKRINRNKRKESRRKKKRMKREGGGWNGRGMRRRKRWWKV